MTVLCELGWKYKTDKCPRIKHHFTEFYDELFGSRRTKVRKVVEIGIGNMAPYYMVGASLFMWREYFPNAEVFGADIDTSLLFETERIRTIECDQTKREDLERLIKITGDEVDLFIDDGLHTPESQVFTCLTVMPLLKNPIYMIEDVGNRGILREFCKYQCKILRRAHSKYNDDCMVMVKHHE